MSDEAAERVAKNVDRGNAHAVRSRARVDFALAVGIDHYPNFHSLRGAAADAEQFYNWVREDGGGRVADDNCRLICSTPDPATPIQDHIDDELLRLMHRANHLGGGRRLYFYFSGHGATDHCEPSENVALLLARWSEHLARVALSSRDYSDRLNGAGLFEELVVFLDCCRSSAKGAVGMPPQVTFSATGQRYPTRNFIAYAADPGASAYEDRATGTWQGVFTRELLAILRASPTGITAALLKDRLESAVLQNTAGQQAHVINHLSANALFGNGGVLPELHVTFRPGRSTVRLCDARGQLIEQHDATSGPWIVALPYGLYKLEDDTPAKLLFEAGKDEVSRVEF